MELEASSLLCPVLLAWATKSLFSLQEVLNRDPLPHPV